jgi:hypothetical protein
MEMPRLWGDCEGLRMICTEDEARKKWCPMVRYLPQPWNFLRYIFHGNTGFTTNRANRAVGNNCIASDCMMWRWTGECKTGVPITSISKHGPTELGYCGLGGKP